MTRPTAEPMLRVPMSAVGRRHAAWDGSGLALRTLVATAQGTVPVEALQSGAELLSASGTWGVAAVERHVFQPGSMRWSGHQPPVRIEAGALGAGLPRFNLVVGAEQGIRLDGRSWPARALVTGTTIRAQPSGAPVVLFRIWPERDADGSTLIAAGVTCDAAPAATFDGDVAGLARLRSRLQRQAGLTSGALLGHLDRATHAGLVGWAFDASNPQSPVCLDVRVGGVRVGTLIADRFRPDLGGASGAPAHCGFDWQPPVAPARSDSLLVSLHRTGDGEILPGGPVLLPALSTAPELLDRALAAVAGEGRPLAGVIAAGAAAWASVPASD